MNEKKVLLRFHLGNERERMAWELLLQRKQQDGCSYVDVVVDALLTAEDHATEISAEQEDRIVERIKTALASCTIQTAASATPAPTQEAITSADISDESAKYSFVDWNCATGGSE